MAPLLEAKQEGNQAASTTWTLTRPVTVNTNDLLVAIITCRSATATITGFDGWTQSFDSTGSGANRIIVLYKRVGASEPASYSLTATSTQICWVVWRISGAPQSGNPINVSAGGGNAASTANHTLPAVTPTVDNTLLLTGLGVHALSTASGWTNGYTEMWDIAVDDGTVDRSQAGASKEQVTGNVSSGTTAVTSTVGGLFSYFTFAIEPGDTTPPAAPVGVSATPITTGD